MVENLRSSIEVLRQRVRSNLDLLHQNEKKIKEILKEPISENRSEKLNKRFNCNKKVLKENNDAIMLQKEMLAFIENYNTEANKSPKELTSNEKSTQIVKTENKKLEIKKEDYLDLTINGALDFDIHHPYFTDKKFFNELLNHFSEIEDYETCSKLTKKIKENNISEY
ncbi:MAG: hypothetical protein GQ564_15995 [Bacteroidales bacterium]|nr:hypothetical protein [Bacteroidales bacterium]